MKIKYLLLPIFVFANSFVGIGDSKKEALADLSHQLSVNVKSEVYVNDELIGKDYKTHQKNIIDLTTDLPIKGVKIYSDDEVKAILDKNSLSAYLYDLKRLKKNIDYLTKKLDNSDEKYFILNQLSKDIETFNKNKVVAILLGAKDVPKINITLAKVKVQLQKYTKQAPSIKIAVDMLAKNLPKDKIYVSFHPLHSNEITPFVEYLKILWLKILILHINQIKLNIC